MLRRAICSLLLTAVFLAGSAAAQEFGSAKIKNFHNGPAQLYFTKPEAAREYITDVGRNTIFNMYPLPHGSVIEAIGDGFQSRLVIDSPNPELTLAPAQQAVENVPPAKTPSAFAQLSEFETELLQMINQARAEHGKPPLRISAALSIAARRHSNDMARTGIYDHIVNGVFVTHRLDDVGYQAMAAAENIAFPPDDTPEKALQAWTDSPPHWNGILSTDHTEIGVGAVKAPNRDGYCWTLKFAKPAGNPTAEATLAKLTQTAFDRLNKPTVLRGSLDATSSIHEGRRYGGQYYTFAKGRTYNLRLNAEFGAMMYLPGGLSASNEQGPAQFDYTATADGEKAIMLITTQLGTTGAYTITVTPK